MRIAARWLSVIIHKPCSPGCPVLNVSIRPQQRWRFIFHYPTSHHSRAPPTIAKEDSSWLVGVRWARGFYKPLSPGVAFSWSWWPHLQSLAYRFSFKWKHYLVIHIGWGTFYPNWLFMNVDLMKTWHSKLRDLWTTGHRVPTLLESTWKYLNFRHMDSRPGKYLKTNIGPWKCLNYIWNKFCLWRYFKNCPICAVKDRRKRH